MIWYFSTNVHFVIGTKDKLNLWMKRFLFLGEKGEGHKYLLPTIILKTDIGLNSSRITLTFKRIYGDHLKILLEIVVVKQEICIQILIRILI